MPIDLVIDDREGAGSSSTPPAAPSKTSTAPSLDAIDQGSENSRDHQVSRTGRWLNKGGRERERERERERGGGREYGER